MNKHIELKNIIESKNSGKIVSSRCNEQYFYKIQRLDLWRLIFDYTSIAPNLILRDRIWYTINQILPVLCKTCNKMYTGISRDNPNDVKPRIYCSRKCRETDPELSEIIKERKAKTNHEVANKKREATMIERFGVKFNSQREEVAAAISNKTKKRSYDDPNILKLIDSKDWIYDQYIVQEKPSTVIADELGIFYGTILDRVEKFGFEIRSSGNSSYEERTLIEYIKETYQGDIILRSKKIIPPYEIDIYIPEKKLAIEYNGLFWHSEGFVNRGEKRDNHLIKTNMCEDLGISLIHINSDWWNNKSGLVKSMISHRLGISQNKIFGRNTKIVQLSNKDQRTFFNNNHLQGAVNAKVSFGLIYNEDIVSAMSFGTPRYSKSKYKWELLRFANKVNYSVVGAASKLFNKFTSTNEGSIISYCDRQYSVGSIYRRLGFNLIRTNKPGYYWTDCEKLYHRSNYMKHKLKNKLKEYDENLSEADNMMNNGYRRYWDSGQLVFEYTR